MDRAATGAAQSVGTIESYRLDPARDAYAHDRTLFRGDAEKTDTVGVPLDVTVEWAELTDLAGG